MSEYTEVTWHYEAGQWTETKFFENEWREGDALGEFLKRLGYEHYTEIGGGDMNAFSLSVYRRDEAPRFIVEYSDGNIWDALTANRLPDAMDLLAHYAPIVTASEISSAVSDIRNLEQYGIVSDVLASAEVNQHAAASQAAQERRSREEARRAARERRAAEEGRSST